MVECVMAKWSRSLETSGLWWGRVVALLMALAVTGCAPEFTDDQCSTDADCFPTERCGAAEVCVARMIEPNSTNPTAPDIDSFEATPTGVPADGGTVTLSWSIEGADSAAITANADSLEIYRIPADALADGSHEVQVLEPTTFTLEATNENGTSLQMVTVAVEGTEVKPQILSFTVSDATPVAGDTITLEWEITGEATGGQLRLGGDVRELSEAQLESGSAMLTVSESLSATLEVSNVFGSDREVLEIMLLTEPVIQSFRATPNAITAGEEVILSWMVAGAESLALTNEAGDTIDLSGQGLATGMVEVTPTQDEIYTLTAVNAVGTVTDVVTVSVMPALQVSLTAEPPTLSEGESATLSWSASTGATSATLVDDQGNAVDISGQPADRGVVMVSPTQDTRYTITVTDEMGNMASAEAAIAVVAPAPQITRFTAMPNPVVLGNDTTLRWEITGQVDTLTLIDNQGTMIDLTGKDVNNDSITVTINQMMARFTLTARNAGGMDSRMFTVTAGNQVSIASFDADETTILRGEMVTLAWSVANATSVSLSSDVSGVVNVPAGSMMITLSPMQTTTYTLTARGVGGPVTQLVTVTVEEPVSIDSFSVVPNPVPRNTPVTIVWRTTAATGLTLMAMTPSGDVPVDISGKNFTSDTVSYTPPIDTTGFRLTATGPGGPKVRQQVVNIYTPARVVSFTADKTKVGAGDTVQLCWQTQGATSLALRDGTGTAVGLAGANLMADCVDVTVTATTAFTLTASGAQQTEDSRTVTVSVVAAPTITNFSAMPDANLTSGDTTTLTWSVSGAPTLVTIVDDAGNTIYSAPQASGTRTVTITADTTFTLTASNAAGMDSDTVDVLLLRAPTIVSLTSNPASPVPSGTSVTLSWTLGGGLPGLNGVILRDDSGTIITTASSAMGSANATVTADTTFTLEVSNAAGTVRQDILIVAVTGAPVIQVFAASPGTTVAPGSMVKLTWDINGAPTSVVVTDGGGTTVYSGSDANGSTVVTVTTTTTYTLTASNAQGTDTQPLTITAKAGPSINQFAASPALIYSGEESTLSWDVNGATSVTILDGDGNAVDTSGTSASMGMVTVRPQATTTYTLMATDASGTVATKNVSVTVGAAPLLISEVYYDPTGSDDDMLEWVEIYNRGTTFVDLSNYSLGYGSADYTFGTLGLTGTLAPGGCVVIGGPTSSANNASPTFDQAVDFNPNLPNSGTDADGIALFFAEPGDLQPNTVPIDAVVYGATNTRGLIAEDGSPKTDISPDAPAGSSLERVGPSSDVFAIQNAPTPNNCLSPQAVAPATGPSEASGTVQLLGFGLDRVLDTFELEDTAGARFALSSCTAVSAGVLECAFPSLSGTAAGPLSLVVTRGLEYVQGAGGAPVAQAVAPGSERTRTLGGAYSPEQRNIDNTTDFFCGIRTAGPVTTTAGSSITAEVELYDMSTTPSANAAAVPADRVVQAALIPPGALPYRGFYNWKPAPWASASGNDDIHAASFSSSAPRRAEVAFRVSLDDGQSFYYCDANANSGSNNGYQVNGGLAVEWQ